MLPVLVPTLLGVRDRVIVRSSEWLCEPAFSLSKLQACIHCMACAVTGGDIGILSLQSFRGWCVLAYECGYREEDLLLKLTEACDNSESPIPAASVPCCLEGVCLIWETLEQSAKPIRRWAKGVLLNSQHWPDARTQSVQEKVAI